MLTRRKLITSLMLGSVVAVAGCAQPTLTNGSSGKPTQAAASAALSPATTGGALTPARGGTVTFALENDVIDFDPLRSRAFVDRNVHYQIYDALVAIDPGGKIIPWLATSWKLSEDEKQVTFTLRDGVTFHDGSPFDADAVKWNLDRYRTTSGSARSGELAPVASVDVVDPKTVRLNLKASFSPLLSVLVDRAGMMVSRKAVEAAGADFTRKAFKAGTGPFILTEAIKDDHIALERNPSWWGKGQSGSQLPFLDKIVVKPITDREVRLTNVRTGDAQIANNIAGKDVAGVKQDSTLVYQQKPGLSFGSLIPNLKPGFVFNEKRYVQAVSMALDRQEILDKIFFGVGSVGYGAIAPPHFAYDASFKPFEKPNPDGAKKLIQDVGKGTLAFEFLVPSGDPVLLQLAELMQSQLAQAGITANLVQLEFAEILQQQANHTFKGMTLVGWSGRIDPDGNTYDHIHTGRPFNDSSYSNPNVDALLDQQRQTTDLDQRKSAFRKAEQTYVVDDPARVWYSFGVAQLVTTKKLQGLVPYPDQIIRFQYGWLQK